MRLVWFARGAAAVSVLAFAAAIVLWLIPTHSEFVFLPDRAHALAPLVHVEGERRASSSGGIYFVDVRFREARLLERVLGRPLAEHADLEDAKDVLGPGVSRNEAHRVDVQDMRQSQRIAAAVALERLGYRVRTRSNGVFIEEVDPKAPAAKRLRPGDEILSVDGHATPSVERLRAALAQRRAGSRVTVAVRRAGHRDVAVVKTIRSPAKPHRTILGIFAQEDVTIRLPLKVRIDTRGVGGPSAGLAFALDLMQELGRDVDHGYKVAATGALALDGSVIPIGAVKQKTIGAREAGVDVFVVPAGTNAKEARRYADGLRVIPVETFPQALHALATLPPKSGNQA
jgi:PDZ domain-containing protein